MSKMSSWKKHVEDGKKKGVKEEIMIFVNKIIDFPEKYLIKEIKKNFEEVVLCLVTVFNYDEKYVRKAIVSIRSS